MRKRQIKRELRQIALSPGTPGAARRVQQLTAEYWKLNHDEPPVPEPEGPPTVPGVHPADQAAVESWPPELRARLHGVSRRMTSWKD